MSGLFKAISRQRSQVNIAGSGREAITTQYTKGRLDTSGVYRNLSAIEEKVLADMWSRILGDYDQPLDSIACDPIVRPVEYDDAASRSQAKEAQETSPFEVFGGCMFNETVADKCQELGI
ncbi:hypothetical protein H4S02_006575, partial [Coemansia sp. RSA 2611]